VSPLAARESLTTAKTEFSTSLEREVPLFQNELPGFDLREVENVIDDGEQVLSRCHDLVELRGLHGRHTGSPHQAGETEDAVHRGADFVRHIGQKSAFRDICCLGDGLGSCQLEGPCRDHLLQVLAVLVEFGIRRLQALLRQLALRNVGGDAEQGINSTRFIPQGQLLGPVGARLSIRVRGQHFLGFDRLPVIEHLAVVAVNDLGGVGVEESGIRRADHPIQRGLPECAHLLVDVEVTPRDVLEEDIGTHVVENVGELLFAAAQVNLGLLARHHLAPQLVHPQGKQRQDRQQGRTGQENRSGRDPLFDACTHPAIEQGVEFALGNRRQSLVENAEQFRVPMRYGHAVRATVLGGAGKTQAQMFWLLNQVIQRGGVSDIGIGLAAFHQRQGRRFIRARKELDQRVLCRHHLLHEVALLDRNDLAVEMVKAGDVTQSSVVDDDNRGIDVGFGEAEKSSPLGRVHGVREHVEFSCTRHVQRLLPGLVPDHFEAHAQARFEHAQQVGVHADKIAFVVDPFVRREFAVDPDADHRMRAQPGAFLLGQHQRPPTGEDELLQLTVGKRRRKLLFGIERSHSPQPGRVDVAERDAFRQDQLAHGRRFETQMVEVRRTPIVLPDELDHLLRMVQRVLPALQAGTQKSFGPPRMGLQLILAGKDQVAIEIHPVALRVDEVDRRSLLPEMKDLVGQVGRHDIDLAAGKVVVVEGMLDEGVAVWCQAAFGEQGAQRRIIAATGIEHDALARHLIRADDVRLPTADEDQRIMLKDRRQGNDRRAPGVSAKQTGIADAVICLAGTDLPDRIDAGVARANLDLEPFCRVVTLRLGSVVTGKLELVKPLELQHHLLERHGKAGGRHAAQQTQQ
jgi:hypothetical protein